MARTLSFPPESYLLNAGTLPEWDFFSPFMQSLINTPPREEGGVDPETQSDINDLVGARAALRKQGGGERAGRDNSAPASIRGLPALGVGGAVKARASLMGLGALAPEMALALAGPVGMGGLAAGAFGLARALGQTQGVVGGPNRPAVGTQSFRDVVGLSDAARAISRSGLGTVGVAGMAGGASGHPGFSQGSLAEVAARNMRDRTTSRDKGADRGHSASGTGADHPGRSSPGSRGGGSTAGGSGF